MAAKRRRGAQRAGGDCKRAYRRGGRFVGRLCYDRDLSFILMEIAGDTLHFQTVSRTGSTVDSGVILRAATVQPR